MPTALPLFRPSAVVLVDIDRPLDALRPQHVDGHSYDAATVLVLLHDHPLGTVVVDLPAEGLSASALADALWAELAEPITAHLQHDGLPAPQELTAHGLAATSKPCWGDSDAVTSAPMVSIVIATKDRTSELQQCITTLLGLDYPEFEIVVVDNGPTDDSTRDMVEASFTNNGQVVYVREQRAGTSNARNVGVAAAKGEIVAFTDDDVIVHRNWLQALVRQFVLHPDVDCVTGLVFPAAFDTQAQQWFEEYGGFNKGYAAKVFDRKGDADASLLYPYTAGTFGSGNNCAFRKSAIERLGGFDLDLGPGAPTLSGEDLDLFLAVIMSGANVAYEPAAIIGHFHRADYPGLKKQIYNYGVGLTALFTKWALQSPVYALDIARRVPMGLWFLVSPKSTKNAKKSPTFPSELGREEMKGMLMGPLAYARAVHQNRKQR